MTVNPQKKKTSSFHRICRNFAAFPGPEQAAAPPEAAEHDEDAAAGDGDGGRAGPAEARRVAGPSSSSPCSSPSSSSSTSPVSRIGGMLALGSYLGRDPPAPDLAPSQMPILLWRGCLAMRGRGWVVLSVLSSVC